MFGPTAVFIICAAILVFRIAIISTQPDQTKANSVSDSREERRLIHNDHVWSRALRKVTVLRPPLHCSSPLLRLLSDREAILTRLQGYVAISDLIHQRELERHIVSLVAATSDFDSSVSRLEAAHQNIIACSTALVSAFFDTDSEDPVDVGRQGNDQAINTRAYSPLPAGSAQARLRRQSHKTKLREKRAFLMIMAKNIRGLSKVLFPDMLTELSASELRNYDSITANPLFQIFSKTRFETMNNNELNPSSSSSSSSLSFSTGETRMQTPDLTTNTTTTTTTIHNILSSTNVPMSHPLYTTILDSLITLSTTQHIIESNIHEMCHELITINKTLTCLVRHISAPTHRTVAGQRETIFEMMKILKGVVQLAGRYECDYDNNHNHNHSYNDDYDADDHDSNRQTGGAEYVSNLVAR